MIFNMSGGGGGSGGLILQFIGSMTAPSNPKENMIWVKTDRAITQFLITKLIGAWSNIAGAVEMTYEASDDYTMTGISTLFFNGKLHGTYGQAWFKPTGLYQSNGTNAEPKDAYIYKSGTWVQFSWSRVYLYNNGVFAPGQSIAVDNKGKGGSFTAENNVLRYRCSGLGAFVVSRLSKNIDVTNLTTIKITFFNTYDYVGTNTAGWSMNLTLGVGGNVNDGVNTITAKASINKLTKNTSYTLTVDVSKLTGIQPVYILLQSTTTSQYLWIDVSVMEAY